MPEMTDWAFEEATENVLVYGNMEGAPCFEPHKPGSFFVEDGCRVNDHAHVPRSRQGTLPEFLVLILSAVGYRGSGGGTTRDRLTREHVGSPVRAPGVDEQQGIADFLERETVRIDALIAKVREAIERRKDHRTALISATVTGKIDVRGV